MMKRATVLLTLGFAVGCDATTPEQTMSPDEATDQVMGELTSTPDGRAALERLGNKDLELTRFQREHDISERIAEAAIKEWVLTHDGEFDWDIDEVKAICLRSKESGIPSRYLPE